MRGFIIYELLDEPAMEAVHPEIGYEAHYGLVRCERDGTIIGPRNPITRCRNGGAARI